MIGLFGDFKVGKPNNVMHVKLLSMLSFRDAAFLASVIVPTSGSTPLTFPVRPVIGEIATAPVRMILASVPCISTIGRAEAKLSSTYQSGRNYHMLTTLLTVVFSYGLVRWLRCNQSHSSCFLIAFFGANNNKLGSNLEWLFSKDVFANLAGMRNNLFFGLTSKLIGTLTAASGLSAKL